MRSGNDPRLHGRWCRWLGFLAGAVVAAVSAAASITAGVEELGSAVDAIPDAAIARWLGDASARADVVAIGESVHGSAAFLRFQSRLVRHLVERQGMRLIIWENPVQRSLAMSRWLDGCRRGNAYPPPLDVLYMPTRADSGLFDWLCAFNRAHPHDPVRFRGMDVWDRPWGHYEVIRRAAEIGVDLRRARDIEACPAAGAQAWPAVEAILDHVASSGGYPDGALYQECRRVLADLIDSARRLGLERRQVGRGDDEAPFEIALSASTLLGWLDFYAAFWTDDIGSWNARDAAQGRNVDLIMQMHGAPRAVLAAHTSHVSHGRSAADWWGYGDLKSGVHFLQKTTPRRVFTIALTGYDVSGTQGHWSVPEATNSIDKVLAQAGHTLAVFRADAAFLRRHSRWWMQNGNFPGPFQSGVQIVPADHFDAYAFFAESHLDEALPARPMWRP